MLMNARRTSRPSRQAGFTLLETMLALSLMSLIFLGVTTLFLNAARIGMTTDSQVRASQDGANTVQSVIEKTREAYSLTLPTEGGFSPPATYTASQFSTTDSGETIETALQLTLPGTLLPATVGYTNTSYTNINVYNAAGTQVALTPYDRNSPNAHITFYRSNTLGVPAPANGTCLWEYSTDAVIGGVTGINRAICKSVDANTANAVQFVRPTTSTTTLTNQVEIKIVTSYYSPINGQQTNEQTGGGNSSQMTGKCVLMRDHGVLSLPPDPTRNPTNNVFHAN